MGSRGPQPLPKNVHVLRGNPSKLPLGQLLDDFRPEVEIPTAPSWMWPEAKKEWKRISAELKKYGLISKLDRAALVLYVQAWAKLAWAEMQMARAMKLAEEKRAAAEERGEIWNGGDGIMVPTVNGNLQYSHYWVVSQRAGAEVNRYLSLFGLSPSSRSRVTTSDNRQGDLFGQEAGDAEWNL